MNGKLLSATEVAAILRIELDTLYRYARDGKIRSVKVGRLWRFRESDVDLFLNQASAPHGPAPLSALLPDLLRNSARFGSRGGVVAGNRTTSFDEINDQSDRLAQELMLSGVQPGDRVLCALSSSVEFVVACFGIWKAGAILVAEDSGVRLTNLNHILEDSRPRALLIDPIIAQKIEELALPSSVRSIWVRDSTFELPGRKDVRAESLDAVLATPTAARAPFPQGSPGDVVSVTYTSGSTGTPKGVMHTHESWLAGARYTRDTSELAPGDQILVPLPLHHGLAFRQVLASVLADCALLIAVDIYQGLRMMKDRRPTGLILVPAAVNIVLDHFASLLGDADPYLRYVEIGSAAIAPDRLRQLESLLPSTRIQLPYGLTEARVAFLASGTGGLYNRIVSVSPGLKLSLVDASRNPVRPGETGEILLQGPGLMKGYWGRPAAEIDAVRTRGFLTGDMGRLTAAGQVELLGRLDDMLKVGGRKVNPVEVEMTLNRHPGVALSAVTGIPDPKGIFENELHAFVVLKDKGQETGASDLLEHCRRQLEPYKVPAHVHFRASLPMSAVGKVLKKALEPEPAVRVPD